MKFYGREEELAILEAHWKEEEPIVDVLIGRRRIGKTHLALQFVENKKNLYFFTSRKEIPALLEEWGAIVREVFPEVTTFRNIDEFLRILFLLLKDEKYVLIFDEFQNFKYIYPEAFSDFQKHIDDVIEKNINVHLLFLGSSVTLMEKVFKDAKEPLFNRATRIFRMEGFMFPLVHRIMRDLKLSKDVAATFDFYSVFNGVPKYYDIMAKEKKRFGNLSDIMKEQCLSPKGALTEEGFFLLQSEFGKDYQKYFDILTHLALGETSITDIAIKLQEPTNKIAVYLNRLFTYYGLIEKRVPLLEPKQSETRYRIKDQFLKFWFRYIYKRLSYIERGNTEFLWKIIKNDFTNHQGPVFEELCTRLFLTDRVQKKLSLNFEIWEYGNFWSKKDTIEIDLIAYDKKKEHLLLIECKLNPRRITSSFINEFKVKSTYPLFQKFKTKKLVIWTKDPADKQVQSLCKQHNVLSISLDDAL